jgi:alkanesulfonate monooxygenase SsuD/methylene tetrahydromethanopterin reductase-like flavin-dependent oxidoreductase (luciferase family)
MSAESEGIRLGLYLDMRNRPDSGRGSAEHHRAWLDRIVEAERLGCPSVWLTEHHFFDDAYLSQCWTMAAAIAARTSQIRIGTAVALLPLHQAVDTAEQVALVDVLSDGRVEPGFGVGYRRPEYDAFDGDYKRRYSVFRERIGELRARWGEANDTGVRPVTPEPIQRPMPMWGGFGGPLGARIAGELGLGLQSIDRALLAPYQEGLEAGGHDPATARMAGNLEVLLTEDAERTWAAIESFVGYRWESYNRHMFQGTRLEGSEPTHFDMAAVKANFLIGTAEDVAARIRERVHGLPVTDLYFWSDFPGISDDQIDQHIESVVTDLVPLLASSTS